MENRHIVLGLPQDSIIKYTKMCKKKWLKGNRQNTRGIDTSRSNNVFGEHCPKNVQWGKETCTTDIVTDS